MYDPNHCNPTATCTQLNECGPENRCYQQRGGRCQDRCDCADGFACNANAGRCVECEQDADCTDPNRSVCSVGGFCLAERNVSGEALCDDTCEFANDDVCDDQNAALCEVGTDCADCGPRSDGDTRIELLRAMVQCWVRYQGTNENQGCYKLVLPDNLNVGGANPAAVGPFAPLEQFVCDDDARGFDGNDKDELEDLFIAVFSTLTSWWPNAIRVRTASSACITAPKSPVWLPDNTRSAIVVDRHSAKSNNPATTNSKTIRSQCAAPAA